MTIQLNWLRRKKKRTGEKNWRRSQWKVVGFSKIYISFCIAHITLHTHCGKRTSRIFPHEFHLNSTCFAVSFPNVLVNISKCWIQKEKINKKNRKHTKWCGTIHLYKKRKKKERKTIWYVCIAIFITAALFILALRFVSTWQSFGTFYILFAFTTILIVKLFVCACVCFMVQAKGQKMPIKLKLKMKWERKSGVKGGRENDS